MARQTLVAIFKMFNIEILRPLRVPPGGISVRLKPVLKLTKR